MSSFLVESVVRGFHVYKQVWHANAGEELHCRRDLGNSHDPYAVAMVRASNIVGHVPKRISSICHIFLRRGGTITCTVTGSRQYSGDLPQGGLEVPCLLKFEGIEKGIELALVSDKATENKRDKSPTKSDNKSPDDTADLSLVTSVTKRPYINKEQLREVEISIRRGDLLSDLSINFAQHILHLQFHKIEGLQSTLLQSRKKSSVLKNQLQIIHSRGNHWIVVSSIGCDDGIVKVYGSLYKEIDASTQEVVYNIFGAVKFNFVPIQKQKGGSECGLFAIAISTAICKGLDPIVVTFNQAAMRDHLIECFNSETMTLFPIE